MMIVHITTELSGGAGGFARNVHEAMQGIGLPFLVLTREHDDLDGVVTLRPISRILGSLRARCLTILDKLGILNGIFLAAGHVVTLTRCLAVLIDDETQRFQLGFIAATGPRNLCLQDNLDTILKHQGQVTYCVGCCAPHNR